MAKKRWVEIVVEKEGDAWHEVQKRINDLSRKGKIIQISLTIQTNNESVAAVLLEKK